MTLTDKQYQAYKDADHDCKIKDKGFCHACEALNEYERQFINDKKALIKREEI